MRGPDVPAPDPSSDERMLVTLGEDPAGGEDFSAGWKNGSFFQEVSAGGAAAGGAGVGEDAGRDGLLKNCVKPPSDDAAGAGVGDGVTPETKIRVISP